MGRQIHFDLARDLLDKQLSDTNNLPFGKVDGVLLHLRPGRPPIVSALEVGGAVAIHRLPRFLRAVLEPIARKFGSAHGKPMIIPMSDVIDIGIDVDVDIDASETQALHWERVARRFIQHIPGAQHGED
jgi:hypothetical protein